MRKLWLHAVVWSDDDTLMGGGPSGQGSSGFVKPEQERGLGPERDREVEGGVDIGGRADPGTLSGNVSYVNEPPQNIVGKVGGGGGPVSLTEGGDYAVGPVSEGGADTGGPGGEQADAASNTGGAGGYLENEGQT